ncbi:MAG: PmoA family protein [candidate division Zixibacteria bacterium]|nr:PmoA family protein [candidate division Zixibacteria bacterium]
MIEIKHSHARHWVYCNGRPVGAYTIGYHRSHVWPLYSLGGVCVIQEYPPDHVHHQGLWAGQDEVNGHNFWAAGHPQYPSTRQISESMDIAVEGDAVTVSQHNVWTDVGGEPVFREERTVIFRSTGMENLVDIVSTRIADFGPVHFGKTKEAGIGMRYNPELEGELNGRIESAAGGVGEKGTFDTDADWIAVSGIMGGRHAGIAILPYPDGDRCPWFTRDYGITLYNPSRHRIIELAEGERYTLAARFAAFDGRTDPAWMHRLYAGLKQERGVTG